MPGQRLEGREGADGPWGCADRPAAEPPGPRHERTERTFSFTLALGGTNTRVNRFRVQI